ncbi:flavin reductase family protein [Microbacterium sp.]|uniref:flavin reductase family protein n=1 Tax=Microbacterium sp. TaxID=51671 RepID=UPI003A8AAAAA
MTATPCPAATGAARADLREVFRAVASSTWVVTSGTAQHPTGFTAISVVSVSVDPPLISFNIDRTSSSRDALLTTGRAGVHLLSAAQADLARRFAADRTRRFPDDGTWSPDSDGIPRIHGVASRLSVQLVETVAAGDSEIVIAEVIAGVLDDSDPLVHYSGGFRAVASPLPTDSTGI